MKDDNYKLGENFDGYSRSEYQEERSKNPSIIRKESGQSSASQEPSRDYDAQYRPTENDIENFPDLQNGPSSLIQGSPVEIQQV